MHELAHHVTDGHHIGVNVLHPVILHHLPLGMKKPPPS
jgi:hypothetical protein